MKREEKYLIGLVSVLRDYLIHEAISKDEIKNLLSLPSNEFIDFVSDYEMRCDDHE